MIDASDRSDVAKKRDSVGWLSELLRVDGNRMKRNVMAAVTRAKMTKSNKYTIFPMVWSPVNVCGCDDRSKARPPVDIGKVYHAQVKCFNR